MNTFHSQLCRVLLHQIKVTEPRYHQKVLEANFSMQWSHDLWAELRLSLTQRPKRQCSRSGKGLRDQEVFDFTMVREYDDVVAEAKKNKKEVHMARVHGICVEKNYQLSEDNPGRKFKGRGVLLGNQVKNQHWEAAFFPRFGKFPCFLRSLTMGRFLWMSSWALRQVGRCDSGLHPG